MDFSVIGRPKRPSKKAAPPPAPAPAPPPPPPAPAPAPPPPPPPRNPYEQFAAHFDQLSRMDQLKSVEFSNSKSMKLNYGEFPNQQFGVFDYSHIPVGALGRGGGGGAYNYNNNHHHHHYPPHMALHPPPQDNRYGLPGPPPQQMDYYRGGPPPQQMIPMPPPGYQYGPPPPNMEQYCHMFNDENPNACMIM